MKKPSTDLHALVHTLTPQEVRSFRLALRLQESQTLRLFESLLEMAEYDEASLRHKHFPQLSDNQFSVAKHYLYQEILLHLLSREQSSSMTWKIRTRLQMLEQLYNRELFDQCRHQLESIRRAAQQLDDPHVLQEVMLWGLKLADRQNHAYAPEEFLALGADFLHNANRQHALAQQQWQSQEFFFTLRKRGVLRTGTAINTDFAAMLEQSRTALTPELTSIAAELTLRYAQATFAFMSGQSAQAYEAHADIIATMEASPGWIASRPDFYLDSIYRLGLMAMEEGRFDEGAMHLGKMARLKRRRDLPAGRLLFYQSQMERLLVLIAGDWETLPTLVARFDADYAALQQRMTLSESATFQFNNAAVLLAYGDYVGAKLRLSALLNSAFVKENPDFDIISKLLLLIVAEHARDAAFFKPWYRSLYRQLHAKAGYGLEKLVLKGLCRAFSAKTQAKKAAIWQWLHAEMVAGDHSDSRAVQYFDFISWARHRGEGRPFAALFQEKVQAALAAKAANR